MSIIKIENDTTSYTGRCAARLRMLREKAGLSAFEVAEAVSRKGIRASYRAVYRWETAGSEPPLSALPILAKLYGLEKPNEILSSK